MTTWYTSDHHFEHGNIIGYCHRPFDGVKSMNDHLVSQHNQLVEENDTVFFLGDLAFSNKPRKWLRKLNGQFVFIRGNHDKEDASFWTELSNVKSYTRGYMSHVVDGKRLHLRHDPRKATDAVKGTTSADDDEFIVCGHVHGRWRFLPNRLNVGVDVWHFRPVREETVLDMYDTNEEMREYNLDNRGYHDFFKEAEKRRNQLGLNQGDD